ncbi:MAG: M56 family metallopeptidase, partial [Pirellulales bacterium]
MAGQFGWLLWCMGRARRLVRAAETVDDVRILRLERELECRFSPGRQVRLMKSRQVRGPLLAGVLRPTILVPDDCARWSDEKLRIVLSHELAHVERRDVLWQLAARAAAAVYWFHPLAWLALRRMRQERERACDDRVLSLGVQAVDYAAGLAEFAAAIVGRPSPLVGSLGMAEQLPLEDRVRSILNASLARQPVSRRVRGILLATTACLVLVLGILRPFSTAATGAADPPKSDDKAAATETPRSETKPAAPPAAKPGAQTEEATGDEPKQVPTKGSMLVRVVGPDGGPIAGAKLVAEIRRWDRSAEWEKYASIKEYNYGTRQDGTVAIKLPELVELLRIWVRKEGYVTLCAMWWPKEEPDLAALPEEFTYRLQRGTVMGGTVKNNDGQPIEGVKVEV